MVRFEAFALLIATAACGGSAGSPTEGSSSFGPQPVFTVMTDSGKLRVDIYTAPQQPPSRGEQTVQYVIVDATTEAPAAGLTLSVVPWMPAMGHGTSVTPTVGETTAGTYVLRNVNLFMPGKWELRTNLSGPLTDHVAPSFQIP